MKFFLKFAVMEYTAKQLAEILDGKLEGNEDVKISGFSRIESGKRGTLCFFANPKYEQYVYTTNCSLLIVNEDFEPSQPVTPTLLRVKNAYEAVANLLEYENARKRTFRRHRALFSRVRLSAKLGKRVYVGDFAYIGRKARIGDCTRICEQVYVGDGVTIGNNCIIYPGVKIYHSCRIGNGCIIHAGAVIGADGFGFAPTAAGYEKIAQIGNVVIDDNVEIGANTTIDRATMGSTHVHQGVKLDNLIQVAHNVEIGEHTVIAAQTGIAGSTKLGSHNMIGGQVGFAGHISVGDNNKIGAQTGIPNNVDDNNILMGYPAVPARDFARQAVWVKKLGSLYADVAEIKKKLND